MMAEKKKIESHLNKKTKMSDKKFDETKVQTTSLVEAEVKLPCVNYETTTPYSVLTQEFIELNAKSSELPFVVDTAELAQNEVSLSRSDNIVDVEKSSIKKVKKSAEKNIVDKNVNYELPKVSSEVKPVELSEIEILNRMKVMPQESLKKDVKDTTFDLPKDVKLENIPQAEKVVDEFELLNELQVDEVAIQKSKETKKQIDSVSGELSELLRQLEEESGDLGIG